MTTHRGDRPSRYRRGALAAATALGTGLALAAWAPGAVAQSDGAAPAETRQAFDIPAGPLDAALVRFGRRTGLTVSVDSALTAGKRSPGVSGELAPRGALEQLLAGTGLGYRISADGTVSLSRRGSGELAPISVEGAGVGGYSSGGVGTAVGQGYGVSKLEAPVASSSVDRTLIDEQDATRLRETLRNVPGVNFSGSYGGN